MLVMLALCACGGGDGGDSSPPAAPATGGGGASNSAPSLKGQPASAVAVSQHYVFQPTATDPDGDALSFSATNLPSWLTLDAKTGRLTGTPTDADVGTYGGITIRVSDGKASASLGPFSITVTAYAMGTATLSWMPPTQNADGTPLTNLAGYKIRYGRSATELSNEIDLDNPSLSTYVVENLSPGTWYFSVVAVNSAGVESDPSPIASKTV